MVESAVRRGRRDLTAGLRYEIKARRFAVAGVSFRHVRGGPAYMLLVLPITASLLMQRVFRKPPSVARSG